MQKDVNFPIFPFSVFKHFFFLFCGAKTQPDIAQKKKNSSIHRKKMMNFHPNEKNFK